MELTKGLAGPVGSSLPITGGRSAEYDLQGSPVHSRSQARGTSSGMVVIAANRVSDRRFYK